MIRSLRTGVSGLKSSQIRMDVVGNNISNVNTIAFKRSRAAFNEVLGQQLLGVGRTAGGTGINPSFVGLGVATGSIDQNWSQGALENTNIATDLALNGDGFFIAKANDRLLLTRAGNFTFNRYGELVTANGLNIQGWAFDSNGALMTGPPTNVKIDLNAQAPARATTQAVVGGNLSADLADGESTSISTVFYDQKGSPHTVVIEFTKTGPNDWSYEITYGGDPANSPFTDQPTGTLNFGTDGYLPDTALPAELDWDPGYVEGGATITIDFSKLMQTSGSTSATFQDQNGAGSGQLAGFSINPEGILELNFTNGEQQKAFQIAIGNVNNPNGLEQKGENFYSTTSASGDLQLMRAGRDLPTAVVSGTLEMSNVDLATEFTDMIIAQRGYQASARVITTSDEMLQETVQLKR